MSDYNGWHNYSTWRVQTEYFADRNLKDFTGGRLVSISDLCAILKDHIEEVIGHDPCGLLVQGWANAFIEDVRWSEIADHLIEADEEFDRWNDISELLREKDSNP
jgi:hypothetical protein